METGFAGLRPPPSSPFEPGNFQSGSDGPFVPGFATGQFSGETPEVIAALKAYDISTRQVVAIHTQYRAVARFRRLAEDTAANRALAAHGLAYDPDLDPES